MLQRESPIEAFPVNLAEWKDAIWFVSQSDIRVLEAPESKELSFERNKVRWKA